MFKSSSLALLKTAAKSDAAAQKAFALAQAAQAKAAKARELASMAEAKERANELKKLETAATLESTQAGNTFMAAVTERNIAKAALDAAEENVVVAKNVMQDAAAKMVAAKELADAARDLTKTTE
jgi:hypothetical protein